MHKTPNTRICLRAAVFKIFFCFAFLSFCNGESQDTAKDGGNLMTADGARDSNFCCEVVDISPPQSCPL